MTPYEIFRNECASLLVKPTKMKKPEILQILEKPPENIDSDMAFPCFILSKFFKKSPVDIAKSFEKKIKSKGIVREVKSIGPYLNFYADWVRLGNTVLKSVLAEKEKYGSSDYGKGKRVMVEYSSPNTNKPLHLGHLRNDSLGMAVSNILEKAGFKIIRAILYSNRGIHICKSMLGYKKWGKGKKPNKKSDHFVGDFYVLFENKKNKQLERELNELLVKWEVGEKPARVLWKKMDNWAVKGFKETYKEFGSEFDVEFKESDFFGKATPIIDLGLKKEVFKEDYDGAIVADLEKYKLPKKVVLREDGTSIYITNDLVLTPYKFKKYRLDKSIWVVGSEQDLYFQQLFKILELLGFRWAKDCHHMSYGMVFLPEGKMKSREGKVIDADDIIEKMKSLAKEEVEKRNKKIPEDMEHRAKAIGLGALKYFLLKMDSKKDIYFNPEESLSFEGDTGPYVQYAHARASSILRKAKTVPKIFDAKHLSNREERELIKQLMEFPRVIQDSARDIKPHYIINYIYKLASSFNNFYEKYSVINTEAKTKNARLALVKATQTVLKNGLNLAGIDAPEKM